MITRYIPSQNTSSQDSESQPFEDQESETDIIYSTENPISSTEESDCEINNSFNNATDSENESTYRSGLSHQLRMWVIKSNITQNATDDLLKILRSSGHPNLPATARTLLLSQSSVSTRNVSNMEYYFFGFIAQLTKHIENALKAEISIPNELHFSLNIDGLPLYKSSKKSLWPVLALISSISPKVVFPIAITCGNKKPQNLQFLDETINEINSVLTHGITIENRSFRVFLSCIVCDAPARSMVKCTKLYSGYYGCDRCEQRGEYNDGKVTFPGFDNLPLRTDTTFRAQSNKEHHHSVSPFCKLPVDMIANFPLDYMHQTCLGVMKRMLNVWIRGRRQNRFSAQQKEIVSARLILLQKHIPNLFARKPRSLDEVDYWKASEFRQFLLYTGRIVLRGILKPDLYSHFLILCIAICILASERLNSVLNGTAKQLIHTFLAKSSELYGSEFMVYNVHCLSHISSDASEFNCLDNCSAFPFENYLQYLKKKIRSSRRPLVQIIKRIKECDELQNPYELGMKNETMRIDNAYILDDNSVCKILHTAENQQQSAECEVFYNTEPAFSDPLNSKQLGIHRVFARKGKTKLIRKDMLTRRALSLPIGNGETEFIEVLHNE